MLGRPTTGRKGTLTMRTSLRRAGPAAIAATLLAGTLVAAGATAATAETADSCPTTPSTVVPGVLITDPSCGFAAVDGSSVYTGILHGSAYRIEIPQNWNGDLIMYAHGYAGTGNTVSVSNPQIRDWYVTHGYAWAASSYRENGYNVGDGVEDTHDLMVHFSGLSHHRAPRQTFMTGVSMGGEITAAEIENYRGQYVGAMPACGVLGANHLFDYYLGANVTAAALSGVTSLQYPTTLAAGTAYTPTFDALVAGTEMPALGVSANTGGSFTTNPSPAGSEWMSIVEQLSGGNRPDFPGALQYYWNSFGFAPLTNIPFLFGLYPGTTGGTIGYADGNVASNLGTTYTSATNDYAAMSQAELNAAVLRVGATNTQTTNAHRTELPNIAGDPGIPVMSLHDIGDLFVPLSMDQIYDREMIAHGQGDLFVDRAIRGTGHCEFSDAELSNAFSALVSWVDNGVHPAGDDILDPTAVASASFGCQFTVDGTPLDNPLTGKATHLWFGPGCGP